MKQEEKNINFSEELAKIKEDLKEQKFLIEAISTINSCMEESLKLI